MRLQWTDAGLVAQQVDEAGVLSMKSENIVEVISRETTAVRSNIAVVDGSVEISYAQLLESVSRVAAGLTLQGINPLDRVAFLCEDCADYVIGSLAILQLGAVVVPISPSLMGAELEGVLDRLDVHYLLGEALVDRQADGIPLENIGFIAANFVLHRREARNDFPGEYGRLNPAFIRFSSGTTGLSKGVLLSHEAILARTDAADQGLRITSADTVIWVLSMSFHFVVTILLYLRRGATVVICRQPFPDSFLEAAKCQRGTVFYASPFHYHVLATSPQVSADCLRGVRLAVSTAMKLPTDTADAFRDKFGLELVEAYGIIEAGLPFISPRNGIRRPGNVGCPQPGYEARIKAPDKEGGGLIMIRGPGFFEAYVSPWRKCQDVLEEGWFNTGDIGKLDPDGSLSILGREKNMINFVGMKIFPDEVEGVLASHPAILECRVYGVAHPQFGQVPCAEWVVRPGLPVPEDVELRRHCYQRLAAHKVPKEFRHVEILQRTVSGKIKRA